MEAVKKIGIKELRMAKGISQGQLAVSSGVSRTMITYLESGKSKCCNLKTISKLAKVLGVEAVDILNGLCEEENRAKIGTSIIMFMGTTIL